ncbi:MAG: hypothetical protein ACREIU_11660, partial [Planctomycetota bacterium]
PTPQPGDVSDYFAIFMPSEAELFQSEPDAPLAPPPSGTNNQILVAATCGLVAGFPVYPYHDNIDGASFGEDYFGVTEVSPAGATSATPWGSRGPAFPEPIVLADAGTSFRFSVDPFAVGLPATDVAVESGGADAGGGPFYTSPGDAAADIFGTPVLTLPALPPGGNVLVHDNPLLALAPDPAPMAPFEDDLDALECVGSNDPESWFPFYPGSLQPGNLHARVVPIEPAHTDFGDLASPGIANHQLRLRAPIFISVDRNSTGAALSAVRTQRMVGEAAGDVFMVYDDPFIGEQTNFLLADEEELGLFPGSLATTELTDDLDGLLVYVHPDDRFALTQLAMDALLGGYVVTHDPDPSTLGDEWREGPGFTTSLLRFALDNPYYDEMRIKIGFSVTTDSVGLEGSAVDFEAGGLDGLGLAQQSGDVYFTYFGPWDDVAGGVNPAPAIPLGTHWLWHEETSLGLDPGTWASGVSADFADLPDELNALDSLNAEPGSGTPYGTACASALGCTPSISTLGAPSPGNAAFSIALTGAEPGTLAVLLLGSAPLSIPLGLIFPGSTCELLVSPFTQIGPIPVVGGAGCSGAAVVGIPVPATAPSGLTAYAQFAVLDPLFFPAPLSISMTPGLPITLL